MITPGTHRRRRAVQLATGEDTDTQHADPVRQITCAVVGTIVTTGALISALTRMTAHGVAGHARTILARPDH